MDPKQIVIDELSKEDYDIHHSLSALGRCDLSINKFGKIFEYFADEEETITALKQYENTPIFKHVIPLFGINDDYTFNDFCNFTYNENFYGFRDNREYSINNDPNEVWCFGCSWTYGVGLPIEKTWPYMIQQMTEDSVKNFSTSAAGPFTTYRLLKSWLENSTYKPKTVYIFGHFLGRIETRVSNDNVDRYYLLTSNADMPAVIRNNKELSKRLIEKLAYINYDDINAKTVELLNNHNVNYKIIDCNNLGEKSYYKQKLVYLSRDCSPDINKLINVVKQGIKHNLGYTNFYDYRHNEITAVETKKIYSHPNHLLTKEIALDFLSD